ncbi:MAG: hypothetical protein ACFE9I_01670 [Candidatus Hermodarchaeota archaeon]
MNVSNDYQELLEKSLKDELEWLIEEFSILFKSKMEMYDQNDMKLANRIIDYILENTYVYDNIILHNLFMAAIENIEKLYPSLFQ